MSHNDPAQSRLARKFSGSAPRRKAGPAQHGRGSAFPGASRGHDLPRDRGQRAQQHHIETAPHHMEYTGHIQHMPRARHARRREDLHPRLTTGTPDRTSIESHSTPREPWPRAGAWEPIDPEGGTPPR